MGGKKNKKRHQNNHAHHNSNNNTHKITQEQMCDLVAEATQIHQLLNQRHQKLRKAQGFAYLLSTKWLKQWKDYVGYDALFSTDEDDKKYKKKMGNRKPSRPNSDLIAKDGDFYQIPQQLEEYQYLNKVVNEKMDLNDDYIPITEQLWNKISEIYGDGDQLKRPLRPTKSGKPIIDGNLLNCDAIFLNYNDQGFLDRVKVAKNNKAMEDVMPSDKLQYSQLWDVSDLFEFLRKYCLVVYNTDQIKIWIASNFIGTISLQQMFVKSVKNQTYQLYLKQQLRQDSYPDYDLDAIIKTQYTLIIQVGDSRLVPAKLPQDMHGYCQQCVQKKKLIYYCPCNKVFYCSRQCQVDDQVVHYKLCDQAFDSDDDQQFFTKKGSGTPLCGLKNLGNTCYMNSSIQLISDLDFLFDFLTSNQYKKIISQQEQDAEMFLNKISKTMKKMGSWKHFDSLQPWSFKSQINHFLAPFRGYKQHDAIDFLTGFLHTVSQCLQKQIKDQIHHQIFKQNMIGKYNSLVICPECGDQIKNIQQFMQIHLPIKGKTVKALFNYTIFESPSKITTGKCQVSHSWKQIFKSLQLSQIPTAIFQGRQNQQQLIPINIDESPEKLLKKMKKQLLIFPKELYKQGDIVLNINLITMKNVCGQSLRALYGYPIPLIISKDQTTGHLLINLIRKLYPQNSELYEQKFIEIQKRYKEVIQKQNLQKKQIQQKQQTKEQDKKSQKQIVQEQNFKLLSQLNEQVIEIMETLKIQILLEDLKRAKNICYFCCKKCQSCNFTPNFCQSVAEFIGHKAQESTILVRLPQKLELNKQKIDYADNGDTKLQQCLKLFGEPQQLDEQNAWWCSKCQDMRLAFKQIEIVKYPKYLLLQFMRFKNGANGKIKNNEPIAYNQFENFGGKKYHLKSVIVHEGSIEGGHYWSINYRKDGYYIFNDQKVSKTQKFSNRHAYILLYKQIDQQMQQK